MSRSTDGNVVTLRGHSAFVPRLCQWLGAAVAVGAGVALYGYATHPNDTVALAVAIAGAVVSIGLVGGARWRLRHPDRRLVVDFEARSLTAHSFGKQHGPIPFTELGPMSLGSTTIVSKQATGERLHMHQSVIGLSKHAGVVLYQPGGNPDLLCFVATLRELVGEEHLPRAAQKEAST
ncbi:MAG TPA: hypothetical protein VML75_12905 [Kofleriaceae bacterium]|nr:hypothetical protein [Kofleriaceae bacterium]